MNTVMLIDFNSFFASVEQQHQPALRGRPVGVLPVMAETTCCIAASVEAKRFGVKTGTGVMQARKLCPSIVFVQAQHAKYVQVHHQAVALIDQLAPVREVLSIDEMSCELPARITRHAHTPARMHEATTQLAREIKTAIASELGACLRVSVGIAPNTLLAKLASDMQKPDGLVVLQPSDIPEKILHLSPSAICGIGPRMLHRLERCGIHSMAQLYAAPRDVLHTVWGGVGGDEMYDMLRGQPYAPRKTTTSSISHSHVMPPAQRNPVDALATLNRLTQKAAMRLRKQQFYATGMSVFVRGEKIYHASRDEHRKSDRSAQFSQTQDTAFLLHTLEALWHSGPHAVDKPKAVGMALHGLVPVALHTPGLFDDQVLPDESTARTRPAAHATQRSHSSTRDRTQLFAAMDRINKTQGKNALYFAAAHGALNNAPMRIAFNRIPDLDTER
jgi:DNA polymerase IV